MYFLEESNKNIILSNFANLNFSLGILFSVQTVLVFFRQQICKLVQVAFSAANDSCVSNHGRVYLFTDIKISFVGFSNWVTSQDRRHALWRESFFYVPCPSFVFYRLTEYVTVLLTTKNKNVVKAEIVRGLRKTFNVQLMIFKWQAWKRQTAMHGKDDLKNSLEQNPR